MKKLAILDINPISATSAPHYPIQTYRHDGVKRFQAALPSTKYRNIVAYYHQVHVPNNAPRKTIYPTGNTAIVFRFDYHAPGAFLVGTPTSPRESEYVILGRDHFVVLFWPGMGYHFFPGPATELTDRYLPLDEILPGESEKLTERMLLAKTFEGRIRVFEGFMAGRMPQSPGIPKQLSPIITMACGNAVHQAGDRWKDCAVYTDRHIRRLFKKYVGTSPKLFSRIMRHQKTLRVLNTNLLQDLAGIAFEQGYYDQSHFIKEFSNFQGCTPTQFVREFSEAVK